MEVKMKTKNVECSTQENLPSTIAILAIFTCKKKWNGMESLMDIPKAMWGENMC
jgi:hypothetical protein